MKVNKEGMWSRDNVNALATSITNTKSHNKDATMVFTLHICNLMGNVNVIRSKLRNIKYEIYTYDYINIHNKFYTFYWKPADHGCFCVMLEN